MAALQDLEVDAARRFRDVGLDQIADDTPTTESALEDAIVAGRLWVAVDRVSERVLGYVRVSVVDGVGHLDEVGVAIASGRRGIGASLIERADTWARANDLLELTLTTFANVPWNAPYYERLGFRAIADDHLGPGLRAIRDNEQAGGLDDQSARVAMRRPTGRILSPSP
ncbi:MAG: GNAT family N-acetyltransferase [Acidimicrobiia bacterium]